MALAGLAPLHQSVERIRESPAACESACNTDSLIVLKKFNIDDEVSEPAPAAPTFGTHADTWKTTILPAHLDVRPLRRPEHPEKARYPSLWTNADHRVISPRREDVPGRQAGRRALCVHGDPHQERNLGRVRSGPGRPDNQREPGLSTGQAGSEAEGPSPECGPSDFRRTVAASCRLRETLPAELPSGADPRTHGDERRRGDRAQVGRHRFPRQVLYRPTKQRTGQDRDTEERQGAPRGHVSPAQGDA